MDQLIAFFIRTWFRVTSRRQATRRIRKLTDKYLDMAGWINDASGSQIIKVPSMPGVDSDMREWSYFMLLEHNAIVNRSIRAVVEHLATGQPLAADGMIDPGKDVLPVANAGPEAIKAFRESCENYLALVETLGKLLRGTARKNHPLFGPFDAHLWHCMFGFHLMVHLRQAQMIIAEAVAGTQD